MKKNEKVYFLERKASNTIFKSISRALGSVRLSRFLIEPDQVVAALFVKELDQFGSDIELDGSSHRNIGVETDGRNDHHDSVVTADSMDVVLGAHHLADLYLSGQLAGADSDVLRTDARYYVGGPDVLGLERLLLEVGELELFAADLGIVNAVLEQELAALKEVHHGHTDEACNKEVDRAVEQLLRSTYLMHKAILHNNYTIGESHRFGLIVSYIHKGGIYALS